MRVTHVITRLIVGGAQENTISTVFGLRQKPGVEVTLLSGPSIGPEGTLEGEFTAFPGLLQTVPSLVREVSPLQDRCALKHLTQVFRKTRPDIVHTHSGKAGVLGRLAARSAGVPVIVHTVHGPSFGSFQGAMANFVFRSAEQYAARATSHFISVADAMTQQYLAAGIGRREQYTRIFSGFDLAPFVTATNDLQLRKTLGIAPGDIVVGKVARLFELKGHDDLFAIAPQLVHACPRMKFLFVGDGPWKGRFEQKARKLGLEKHFIFTGLVRPAEVSAYVGIMDMLVHLSRREGLPRALPQALAARKPVIAYACDGSPEVCFDNQTGFLVPVGNLEVLTNRVLELANDETMRRNMGAAGQAFVQEHFPVQRMVDDIYSLYQELLKEGHLT